MIGLISRTTEPSEVISHTWLFAGSLHISRRNARAVASQHLITMSAQNKFHSHLLRPAIIHILRAQGFHSTRPSVLDTITDLAARYLSLLAQRTAYFVYDRTTTSSNPPDPSDTSASNPDHPTTSPLQTIDASIPTIPDIRLALSSAAVFNATTTASEEVWAELLRKPLSALPAGAQDKERRRRDEEDTLDVQDFLDWITGAANAEIMRIAGLQDENGVVAASAGAAVSAATGGAAAAGGAAGKAVGVEELEERKDDYLALLRKKRSKTGEGSRFAGTALGLSLIHISEPTRLRRSRMPSSA